MCLETFQDQKDWSKCVNDKTRQLFKSDIYILGHLRQKKIAMYNHKLVNLIFFLKSLDLFQRTWSAWIPSHAAVIWSCLGSLKKI